MHISAKTEYACLAVMELAIQFDSGKPVRVGAIAERRGISSQFLVQILLQLKGAGIVASTRGAAGGYRLARAPCEVTLWQVMRLFQGEAKTEASKAENETPLSHTLNLVWDDVAQAERQVLDSITLADLVERTATEAGTMYYI